MMQSNGGLLDSLLGRSQGTSSSPLGGLLGAAAPQSGGLQMAQQLSQSPTPDTARQIIAQLHQIQNPEAAHFEQVLTSVMNNPQALKQVADAVLQKLGGQHA